MELVLAAQHQEKLRELKKIIEAKFPDIRVTCELIPSTNCKAKTFSERACSLAISTSARLQKPCLAEESGLIVLSIQERLFQEELRRSGLLLPDTAGILSALSGNEERREAYLECALSFATPGQGAVSTASCRMEGHIATEEKGSHRADFGTIFIKHDYGKTLAELSPSTRERISHRKKACEKLFPSIKSHIMQCARPKTHGLT